MLIEIFHFYQQRRVSLRDCISAPLNVMKDEQREGKHFHSFFYNCQGNITKIIKTGTCLLLLWSCGTLLCFLSFASRKPNMDKLGGLRWGEKSVTCHRIFFFIWKSEETLDQQDANT